MRAASVSEAELLTELHLAVERDELSLLYQPKVAVADNRLVGVEALARWPHRTLGVVEPSTFVPLAERYGLIDELTDWVLRRGLKQWVTWSEQGLRTNIAFNVSALSLRDVYFPDYLHRLCQTEGVPANCLTIEVTEGATQHLVRLLDTLTRFRLKGMSLALDDFGTGYSSLLQLRQLPYNELKVDQCFVGDSVRSRESRLIVKAVIDLAHGLGLAATAEGVEDAETLALLAELGCDHAQGYFIARAMEGWELAPWLVEADGDGRRADRSARAARRLSAGGGMYAWREVHGSRGGLRDVAAASCLCHCRSWRRRRRARRRRRKARPSAARRGSSSRRSKPWRERRVAARLAALDGLAGAVGTRRWRRDGRRDLSRRIAAEGALLAPDDRLARAAPAPGTYRCRYVRPGGRQVGGFAAGAYCYVGVEAGQLSLATELRGLRLGGYLWELKGGERLVFLGASVPPGARTAPAYGVDPAARLRRIWSSASATSATGWCFPSLRPGAPFTIVEMVAAPQE